MTVRDDDRVGEPRGRERGRLVTAAWIIDRPGEPPRRDAGVRVVGDRVVEVGDRTGLVSRFPEDDHHHDAGAVLAPGFVNAHVHMYGVLAHGIPVRTPPGGFASFLEDFWWPQVEDALDHSMIGAAAEWVCQEMVRGGTTSFLDVLEAPGALPDALLHEREVVAESGLRGVLSFEATERAGPIAAEAGLQENLRLIEECRLRGGIVDGIMCFHTRFTCSPPFVRRAFDLAREQHVLVHAHCNEGTFEGEWCEREHGMRTVELYEHEGLLGPDFLASQCVQVSPEEIRLLGARAVKVAHMPLANCEVGGGIAPVPELTASGATLGLGSDGYVNDMFEVMRGAFLLHKARLLDPRVMPAGEVFRLATSGGAAAIGLDRVGELRPGWAADLQLIGADLPTPLEEHNVYDQLVLHRSARDVRDVMVAGEWRVRRGEVVDADPERARARLHEQAERLWAR